MKIPTEFIIHGHIIKVIICGELENEKFGDYDCVKEEIRIARNMRRDCELIPLSDHQIETTFLHELIHVMQWHSGKEFSEEEAQTYSGMLYEFLKTKKDE